jgi:ribokinase
MTGRARWRAGNRRATVGDVPDVVVVGQVGRDLVLRVAGLPGPGGSAAAAERHEVLGGKGANQAVALAQLGVPVALVGVVGADRAGEDALAQAVADGIDVAGVRRRGGTATALLLDLVEDGGTRRLVESVPDGVLLTADDVAAAGALVASCALLSVQLQTPGSAVRAALDRVPRTALVVTDGAPDDDATRTAVLARADAVRADAAEAALLLGRGLPDLAAVRAAAAELLAAGPRLVSLAAGEDGDLVAWRAGPPPADDTADDPRWADGAVLVPHLAEAPVDPTGAGDASVAALAAALLGGAAPEDAAWRAAGAAALTVARAGGRPALSPSALAGVVSAHRPG